MLTSHPKITKDFKINLKCAMRHFLREISRKKVEIKGDKKAKDSDPVNIVNVAEFSIF